MPALRKALHKHSVRAAARRNERAIGRAVANAVTVESRHELIAMASRR